MTLESVNTRPSLRVPHTLPQMLFEGAVMLKFEVLVEIAFFGLTGSVLGGPSMHQQSLDVDHFLFALSNANACNRFSARLDA